MSRVLSIDGWGAVTPVGMSCAQSCAAIRARINAFMTTVHHPPPDEPTIGARVPVHGSLQRSHDQWLTNLSVRAIREALLDERPPPTRTALVLVVPERFREHAVWNHRPPAALLDQLRAALGYDFCQSSRVLDEGAASLVDGLRQARELLYAGAIDHCVVGGADSLLEPSELGRLRRASRLHWPNRPQGIIPGEGASFLLVARPEQPRRFAPLGRVLGLGLGREPNPAAGDRFATGEGLRHALLAALSDAGVGEPEIDFLTTNFNGERYAAIDMTHAHARVYRTRRATLPMIMPSASVGELGVAAGGLTLATGIMAIARGYAPGEGLLATCEITSEGGLRGACVVTRGRRAAFRAPGRRALMT